MTSGISKPLVRTLFLYDDAFVAYREAGLLDQPTLRSWDELLERGPRYPAVRQMLAGAGGLEPMDAALLAVRAVVAFDRIIAAGEDVEPELHEGWRTVVAPALAILRRAGAVWGPRELARTALDRLRGSAAYLRQDERTWLAAEAVEPELAAAEQAIADHLAEAAYALREHLPEEPVRAAASALYWTCGEVPRAAALLTGAYEPSVRQLRRLVVDSFRRVPADPLTRQVWIALEDRLGRLAGLHHRLRVGAEDDHLARLYAHAVLGVHATPREELPAYELFALMAADADALWRASPSAWLRFAALVRLAGLDGGPPWAELVGVAAGQVRRESGLAVDPDEYDTAPGIACHYLDTADLGAAIEAVEGYRAATLWYWRQLGDPGAADLRRLVQGARFAQTALRLPSSRLRLSAEYDELGETEDIPALLREAASADNLARLGADLAERAASAGLPTPHAPTDVAAFARALTGSSGSAACGAAAPPVPPAPR